MFVGEMTPQEAWERCDRGDWMLWICNRIKVDERKLFLAKGLVAKTVIHLMTDIRSINAVNAVINYENGVITTKELIDYANAAADVATTYAANAANAAANAAAFAAAYAAYAATYATCAAAAYAADAAANAANAANADADKALKENRNITANICRDILTQEFDEKIKLL